MPSSSYPYPYPRRSSINSVLKFCFAWIIHFIIDCLIIEILQPIHSFQKKLKMAMQDSGRQWMLLRPRSERRAEPHLAGERGPERETERERAAHGVSTRQFPGAPNAKRKRPFRLSLSIFSRSEPSESHAMIQRLESRAQTPPLAYLELAEDTKNRATGAGPQCEICYLPTSTLPTSDPPHYFQRLADINTEYLAILPCTHSFGHKCLLSWLASTTKPSCPSCRYNLRHSGCGHYVVPALPAAAPAPLYMVYGPGSASSIPGGEQVVWKERRASLPDICVRCRLEEGGTEGFTDVMRMLELRRTVSRGVLGSLPMEFRLMRITQRQFDEDSAAESEKLAKEEAEHMAACWISAQIRRGEVLRRVRW